MAKFTRHIPAPTKRLVIDKAGGKCANPGCSHWQVHIHHIKHWAIYQAHDEPDLIALCPTCHAAAHHGALKITDELLYQWKGIARRIEDRIAVLHVEPAAKLKAMLGSLCMGTINDYQTIFSLENGNQLGIRILDRDLLQINARIHAGNGSEFLRVVENNVRVARGGSVEMVAQPGHVQVNTPASESFLPAWAIAQARVYDPNFAANGRATVLDLQVLKPGLVKIRGCWPHSDNGLIILDKGILFAVRGNLNPTVLCGPGDDTTTLVFSGPPTTPMFGFAG